ncbi:hypothetical protein RJ639_021864, partial [Escallonia herrerae]
NNPTFAKFRYKNLDIYKNYYDPMFRDITATGERAYAPSQGFPPQGSGVGSVSFGVDDIGDDDTTIVGEEGDSDDVQPLVGASLEDMTTDVNTSGLQIVFPELPKRSLAISENHSNKRKKGKDYMEFFEENSMHLNKVFCEDENSDEEELEHEKRLNEEQKEFLLCSIIAEGIIMRFEKNYLKTPCRTSQRTRTKFILEILEGNETRCYQLFRLQREVFLHFCDDLKTCYGLKDSRGMMIHEEVGIFLFILAYGVGNRLAQDMFQHSGETISRHFHKVLRAVCKLSEDIIKPDSNYINVVPEYIRTSSKYYPYFKVSLLFFMPTLFKI